jgi:hypothetical protein
LPGSRHSGHRNTEAGLDKPTPESSEASHLVDYEELVWIHVPDLEPGDSFSY